MRELFIALRFLRDRDISHRDLKKDNIFLDCWGRLVLGDLGSLKFITQPGKTKNTTNIATGAKYMSEEMGIDSKIYDSEIDGDVYECGCLLASLLGLELGTREVRGRKKYDPKHAKSLENIARSDSGVQRLLWRLFGDRAQRADVRLLGDVAEHGLRTQEARAKVKEKHMDRRELASDEDKVLRFEDAYVDAMLTDLEWLGNTQPMTDEELNQYFNTGMRLGTREFRMDQFDLPEAEPNRRNKRTKTNGVAN